MKVVKLMKVMKLMKVVKLPLGREVSPSFTG
jgi:hypothetical protein